MSAVDHLGAVLRTLRTILLLALTLVFFGVGQRLGGYFEGVLWFMSAGSAMLAFA